MRIQVALALLVLFPSAAKRAVAQSQPWQPKSALADRARTSNGFIPPPASRSVSIGNFYLARKAYPGALSRFLEAARTDPFYAPAYLGLGKVYEKLGEKRKALAAYKKYLDELPSEKQAEEDKIAHRAIRRLERDLGPAPSRAPYGLKRGPHST